VKPLSNNPSERAREATGPYSVGGFIPPTPEELAKRLPNLEVLELVSHGGMGVVYKGRQPMLDRIVAIKVVRPDLLSDPESQQRFLAEARTLAKLEHPYIVTVYDFGKAGELYYLVMQFVDGTSLRELISHGKVSERDVLDFVPQIGEALQHAHDNGVVHRDVKPENVIVDQRNRVRLVDFGLAKVFGPATNPASIDDRVAGTMGYMAPEQFTTPEKVDHRADIYSTGVVCYEMLTGHRPRADASPPSTKASVDRRFDPIVLKAMERDRERRYQQARQFNADFATISRRPDSIVRLEQTVPAPRDRVFSAWTSPVEVARWFAPTDQFTTPIAEVDLRVGGNYRFGMKPPDPDPIFIVRGQYCTIDFPRSLSFTWAWDMPRRDDHETQVTLEFREQGNATNLILLHERFRDENQRLDHTKGWTGCLSRLARKVSV
jgi:serine/threonine protein kinase